ncbi:MAG: hypothetical protein PVH63_12410, partial [Balneolaceae bacterium]
MPKNGYHQPTHRRHFDRNPECLRDEAEKSIMAKSVRSFSGDKKNELSLPFTLMQKGEKIKAVDSESVSDCGRNNVDGPLARE